MAATELHPTAQAAIMDSEQTLICTIVTADTMPGALEEIERAAQAGADVIELRADYLTDFEPETDVKRLLDACAAVQLPAIFTYRPAWEGCAFSHVAKFRGFWQLHAPQPLHTGLAGSLHATCCISA